MPRPHLAFRSVTHYSAPNLLVGLGGRGIVRGWMGVAACVWGIDVSGRAATELGLSDGGARSGLSRHSGGRVRGDRIPTPRDALAVDLDSARHPAAGRVPGPAPL